MKGQRNGKKRLALAGLCVILLCVIGAGYLRIPRTFARLCPDAAQAEMVHLQVSDGSHADEYLLEGEDLTKLLSWLDGMEFYPAPLKSSLELREQTFDFLFFVDGEWVRDSVRLTDLGKLEVKGRVYEIRPMDDISLPVELPEGSR